MKGANEEGPVEVETYRWLENESNKSSWLLEDVRLLDHWNQALTLLWFEQGAEEGLLDSLLADGGILDA